MIKYLFPVLLLLAMACNQSGSTHKLLSTSNLPGTELLIDPYRDTTVHTPKGAIITIKAGSLRADKPVRLLLKEAYSMADIIKGRLLTISNGKPLSSGGMIYLSPIDQKVEITKPITVAIPTPFVDPRMTLYKGEEKDGELSNWQEAFPQKDTTAVYMDSATIKRLSHGEHLFTHDCSPCHQINKALTAPPLMNISERMKAIDPEHPKLLYDIIRNNQSFLASDEAYFNRLYAEWNKTPMPAYPNFTDEDLKAIISYIDNESRLGYLPESIPSKQCIDSCRNYVSRLQAFNEKQQKFVNTNTDRLTRRINIKDTIGEPEVLVEQLTNTDNIDANRYQFNISSWGWQNVDMLTTKMNGEVMDFVVEIPEAKNNDMDVYLVVPGIRIFLAGARREENSNTFYFIDPASQLTLPKGQKAFVIAMTESDEGMLFGKTDIITGQQNQIRLNLKPTTANDINEALSKTDATDLKIRANEAKHATEAKSLKLEKKSIDSLKPANCNCDVIFHTNKQA